MLSLSSKSWWPSHRRMKEMDVSKNSGILPPKWMVKIMENPYEQMDYLGGFPYFWKHPNSEGLVGALAISSSDVPTAHSPRPNAFSPYPPALHGRLSGWYLATPKRPMTRGKEGGGNDPTKTKLSLKTPRANKWVFPKKMVPPNHPF